MDKLIKEKHGFTIEHTKVIDGSVDEKFEKLFNKILQAIDKWCKENNKEITDRKAENLGFRVYTQILRGQSLQKAVNFICDYHL